MAASAVRPNSLKARIANGERVINAWCSIASSHVAEAVAHQGVDSVTIDLQHGAIDFAAAFHMLQGISTSPATPLARVPWNEPAIMTKVLDAGAYGIICPMIETQEQAAAFVAACRYPPLGSRSYGPNRVSFYAGADYARHANGEILLLAQVETRRAVENVNAILAVPGLDGVYVGPADLSLSYGAPPSMAPTDATIVDAMDQVRERARSSGLIAGVHTDGAATARRRFAEGYQLCSLPTDLRLLLNAVRGAVDAAKA
jgi:4-hydroxy-2-oxoheptanedioate aldolase